MGIFDRILGRADAARPLASGTRSARADGHGGRWTNANTGLGSEYDRRTRTTYVAPIPLDVATVDALLEFQAIGRRIVYREPQDCTRKGYELTGMPADIADALAGAADGNEDDGTPGLDMLGASMRARAWARAFGGGAIYVLADDGRRASEPLDVANLRAVNALEPMDRHELVVAQWGIDPNDRATFNRPVMYATAGSMSRSELIHASRVIPFQGNELPPRVMLRRGGWGGSVLDIVWDELQNYASVNASIVELMNQVSQAVFRSKHLANAIDGGDEERVIRRYEAMALAMGIFGAAVLDSEDEAYEVHNRPVSGLKDPASVTVDALVAATDMPRSILLGESPGGINAGENLGELEAWYGHCGSLQGPLYTPAARRILALLMLSKNGPTRGQLVPGWGLKWRPLWELDEKERSELDLRKAQRRQIDVQSSVVSPDEVRKDPDLARHYGIDPNAPAPEPIGDVPGGAGPGLPGETEDDGELEPIPVSTDPPPGDLVSARVASQRLGGEVSPAVIHGMAARNKLRAFRPGHQWLYSWAELSQALAGGLRAVQ